MVQKRPIAIPPYRGLFRRVAKKLAVDPSYVSRVARGERRSKVLTAALKDEIRRLQTTVPEHNLPENSSVVQEFLLKRLKITGAQFLHLDVDIGLTFAAIAQCFSHDAEKHERNKANAYKAYLTVQNLLHRAPLFDADARAVQRKLNRLQSVLRELDGVRPLDGANGASQQPELNL